MQSPAWATPHLFTIVLSMLNIYQVGANSDFFLARLLKNNCFLAYNLNLCMAFEHLRLRSIFNSSRLHYVLPGISPESCKPHDTANLPGTVLTRFYLPLVN